MSLKSGIKNFVLEKVMSQFSIGSLSSHSTAKLRSGNLLCFTKSLVLKNFRDKGVGGASITIFRQIVLSHSTESSRRRMLLCFKSFGYRKTLGLRGEYNDFLLKKYCLTEPKPIAGNPLVCH